METVFRFVIAALASWRLSFLLARENGPWRVLARVRDRLAHTVWGDLLSCVKCVGLWISIPFAFFVVAGWIDRIVTWLALAGVTALIDEWTRPPFEWQETKSEDLLRGESDRTAQ